MYLVRQDPKLFFIWNIHISLSLWAVLTLDWQVTLILLLSYCCRKGWTHFISWGYLIRYIWGGSALRSDPWPLVLWFLFSMSRLFQVESFHFMVRSFRSFSVKLDGEHASLAYGLENKVHTWAAPLLLLMAERLVKSSDYIVERYDC